MRLNEAVSKSADDFLLAPDEAYGLTFEKRVTFQGRIKIARASFDIRHKQFMEIVEKYGLKPAPKWQIWDTNIKANIPYKEG